MLGQLEDIAAVDPLALENGGRVMERVAEHMDPGVAPGHHFAVKPDKTVAVVE